MNKEKPTRTYGKSHLDEYEETHPAYAMIGASRVQGMAHLAGSDFQHQGYVVIELCGGSLHRGLSNDRWHGGKSIVRVALSEAQWATFVSAMNIRDGVPCTLERVNGAGLPEIDPIVDRKEQFTSEVKQTMQDALDALVEAHDTAPTKKLKGMITKAIQEIRANIPFVEQQFGEHMERTVEKAKIEVNAYVTGAIQRAGLAALAEHGSIQLLSPSSTPSTDK